MKLYYLMYIGHTMKYLVSTSSIDTLKRLFFYFLKKNFDTHVEKTTKNERKTLKRGFC